MTLFAVLSFISFLISIVLGVYVLSKASNKRINIIFFVFCLFASALCFIEYELRMSESLERAIFWSKTQSIWPFSIALTLHFIIVIIGVQKRKKLIYSAIYIPATALFFIDLQTHLLKLDPIQVPWGWSLRLSNDFSALSIAVWIAVGMALSVYLPYKYYSTFTGIKRKQVFYIFIAYAINFIFVLLTDVVLPFLGYKFPELSNTLGVIPFTIIAYAIWKYQLFEINPNSLIGKLMQTLNDGVFLTNAHQEIIEVNNAGLNMLGYTLDELVGKKIDFIVDQATVHVFNQEHILKIIEENDAINDLEVNFCSKNNQLIPVSISISISNIEDKNNFGYITVARNMSVRKQATTALKDAYSELEDLVLDRTRTLTIVNEQLQISTEKAKESDRLKSAFLANMSHEIRTPMNGILGFTELLKEPNLTGELQETYIEIIEESGMRMLTIINDIVSISKIESGLIEVNNKEFNINTQQDYLYTFFKPEAEAKNIKLSYTNSLPAHEAVVNTDQDKFMSVFTNLIKNALKYTDQGAIEFGYHKKENHLEFYIKDTGIGIDTERQDAIFERFIQADIEDKMARQGAGLGLSISKAYVEMLDGSIHIESVKGKGSTFYFTIPYTAPQPILEQPKHDELDTNLENEFTNLNILLVEDDQNSALLLLLMLQKTGCKFTRLTNGNEAVQYCQNNNDIDLILMDIKMPQMDGYEATRQIRQFNKDVIIIAQTSHAFMEDIDQAMLAGCNQHLSKPIMKKELFTMIRNYCK